MIGTAAIPITALSAKLISMNRNNSATISQASFGGRALPVLATLMGASCKEGDPHPVPSMLWYDMVPTQGGFFETMKTSNSPVSRILGAAFEAFAEEGYAGASTLDIATRAKVSKRDLYANFANKHEVLVACIKSRADRMRLSPDLPIPRSPQMLASTLTAFATNLVLEVSHPSVIATFRLAIAEATRSPAIAQALDVAGRDAAHSALAELLANAQSIGLVGPGEPREMAAQYLGLLWENLMVGLLLGVAATPEPVASERRATRATAAFMQLHPDPAKRGQT